MLQYYMFKTAALYKKETGQDFSVGSSSLASSKLSSPLPPSKMAANKTSRENDVTQL